MRRAESVLAVIRQRGERRLPLDDVYRQLFNPALYLQAYGKIYRNDGAMTKGVTSETVDGMSQRKIAAIIEALRYERYRWTPARRVYIEKKHSTKKRPLGIPTWSDKLLQEVIREILEAYFEPQFSLHSHGFRPVLGCHTALTEIERTWKGTVWFIEGDISGCFDNIDHEILMGVLREKIKDNRFLRLIENLLKAGYLEDWHYHRNLSGTPQGAGCSPILANIYLDRLDQFFEHTLVPMFNRGNQRKPNRTYSRLSGRRTIARRKGNMTQAAAFLRAMRTMPAMDSQDPDYRRLRYVRYADDFLLGFAGPRHEAEEIKHRLTEFLRDELRLPLSDSKTLITHGRSERARFLGYELTVSDHGTRIFKREAITTRQGGNLVLLVPRDVVEGKVRTYCKDGKSLHRRSLVDNSIYDIITQYQQEYRGLVQYYALAHDRGAKFAKLRWTMETSLVRTLASKLKTSVKQVYARYHATIVNEHGTYKGLRVTVPREGKEPLVATWGGISLARPKNIAAVALNDQPAAKPVGRTELVQRLLADTCEICGSQARIEVHHISRLNTLRTKGRRTPPFWKQMMLARKRKTLVLCKQCHDDLHAGRLDGRPDREDRRAG